MALEDHREGIPTALRGGVRICGASRNSDEISLGDEIRLNNKAMANCSGCGNRRDYKQTAPVGLFAANPFGLYDMVGNVWEWTEDCWNDSYQGVPANGSAWTSGDCSSRVIHGGSWFDGPDYLRLAKRSGATTYILANRVARTLTP
jgi:formylglycine-generating enzyme required for sulfatase activity